MANSNYDVVNTLDLLKDQISSGIDKAQLISNISGLRSRILQRSAYRDMCIKNVTFQAPMMMKQLQQPHQQQLISPSQAPNQLGNISMDHVLAQNQHQQLPPNPPFINQQVGHVRNGSATSSGAIQSIQQQQNANYPRNSSNVSLTSNPFFNTSGFSQMPFAYSYSPGYQSPLQPPQQHHFQPPPPPPQSLPHDKLSVSNPTSNDSSVTKVPTTSTLLHARQNPSSAGPTSNPQPHAQPQTLNQQQQEQQQQQQQQQNSQGQGSNRPRGSLQKVISNSSDESPFLQRDIRYSVSVSSGRSRNQSIYDPLQPLPFPPPPQTMVHVQGNGNPITAAQYYAMNQQQMMNYPNVDPAAISRQYSLNQMYTPVGTSVDGPRTRNDRGDKTSKEVANKSRTVSNGAERGTWSPGDEPGLTNRNVTKNESKQGSRNGSFNNSSFSMSGIRKGSLSGVKSPDVRTRILNPVRSAPISTLGETIISKRDFEGISSSEQSQEDPKRDQKERAKDSDRHGTVKSASVSHILNEESNDDGESTHPVAKRVKP